MNTSQHIKRLAAFTLVAFLGCQSQNAAPPATPNPVDDPAASKSMAIQPLPQPDATRILAAIVPHDGAAWYFKVTGKAALLEAAKPDFISLLQSISFPTDKPAWKLPAHWTQQPASGMRFATLIIKHNKQSAELSVISLSQTPLLPQVNRWRGQIGLKPITEKQLPADTQTIAHDKLKITLADITGTTSATPSAPATPALAGAATPAGHPALPTQTATPNHGASIPNTPLPPIQSYYSIDYKAPKGWTELPPSGMRVAAFQVGSTQVTVIPLSAAAGDLTANVNRWRGQVELKLLTEKEIRDDAKTIMIDGIAAQWVHLTGANDNSMLGLIAIKDSKAWFVKMLGPTKLVNDQIQNFKQFAQSIQFSK